MTIKIHGLPASNIHPSIAPASMLKQSRSPLVAAKLIWQVCIKAPDQYPLRAVRAKAKKNSTSPPEMRKNESWTLFSPLLAGSALLSPALYQNHTHTRINTGTDAWKHKMNTQLRASITRLTSHHWSAAVKLTEGLWCGCVPSEFQQALNQRTTNCTTLIKSRLCLWQMA